MTATATKRLELPMDARKSLHWCERLVQLSDRMAFYARVKLEARSRGEEEVATMAARKFNESDLAFWRLAISGGCMPGRVKFDDLVTAVRRYVAEYRP